MSAGGAGRGSPAAGRPARRVLLVEDDEHYRAPLRLILERAGYRVEEAETAGRALDLAEAGGSRFDAVLLDYFLPDGCGPELLDHLRRRGVGARAAIISAHPRQVCRSKALAAGAHSFSGKPASANDVLALVDTLVD